MVNRNIVGTLKSWLDSSGDQLPEAKERSTTNQETGWGKFRSRRGSDCAVYNWQNNEQRHEQRHWVVPGITCDMNE